MGKRGNEIARISRETERPARRRYSFSRNANERWKKERVTV